MRKSVGHKPSKEKKIQKGDDKSRYKKIRVKDKMGEKEVRWIHWECGREGGEKER